MAIVVHVCPSKYGGGAEKVVGTLVRQLSLYGDTVYGCYFCHNEDFDGSLERNEVSFGNSKRSPLNLFSLIGFLKAFKSSNEEVIVHAHLTWPLYYCFIASFFLKIRLVYTEHHVSNKRRGLFFFRWIDRIVYSRFSELVCISEGVRESLEEWLGGSGSFSVISNGVAIESPFVFDNEINKNDFSLLSVGRLVPVKNFQVALEAFSLSELHSVYKTVKYSIVGEGSEKNNLNALCDRLNISVDFVGWCSSVDEYYKNCDVLIVSSLSEGFGLVAVEAMSYGLPVIASDVPGLREVVDIGPEGNILVTEYTSPGAWCDAIHEMANRIKYNRKSLAEKCRAKAELFSIDSMVKGYVELYCNLHRCSEKRC